MKRLLEGCSGNKSLMCTRIKVTEVNVIGWEQNIYRTEEAPTVWRWTARKKYGKQLQAIKENYRTFDIPYNGKVNDDYVNSQVCPKDIIGCTRKRLNKLTFHSLARQFCCNDGTLEAAQACEITRTRAASSNFKPND